MNNFVHNYKILKMLNIYILSVIDQAKLTDTNSVNNIAELLMKGGFIMIPIILLSIFSVYLFIERYSYIRKTSVIDESLVKNIINELKNNRPEEALMHTRYNKTSLGKILESGLSQKDKSAKAMESNIESAANLEIAMMEKDMGYLGIIAGVAPMLGFIGTISGVIKIFYNISLSDNISIGNISSGLYQKMICSGTGLIVGVIAYSCYHVLLMMIDRYSINLQKQVNEVVKVL
jgi:biopolymer transport protein ExbB